MFSVYAHHLPKFSSTAMDLTLTSTSSYGETIMSQEGTTQGDPLAMAMHAISTVPLIHQLSNESIKQAWFTDDASAAGNLSALRQRWDRFVQIGPEYGQIPPRPGSLCKRILLPSYLSLSRFWCIYHIGRQEAFGSSSWFGYFEDNICPRESCCMGVRSRTSRPFCSYPASCIICRLHAWIG